MAEEQSLFTAKAGSSFSDTSVQAPARPSGEGAANAAAAVRPRVEEVRAAGAQCVPHTDT